MLLGNESLLAILHQWAGPDVERPESAGQTPQYMYLLLAKVALNCFLVLFTHCGLARSFMGFCLLSLCLADFLLAVTLGTIALLGGHHGDPSLVAFLLTHSSCIYAFLPLPVLALGAVDSAFAARKDSAWSRGTVGQVGAVLAMWAAAGFYSAWRTDPSVQEVAMMTHPVGLAQVCEVQTSRQVTLFCLVLLAGIVVTLLRHLPNVPRWLTCVNRLTAETERAGNSESHDAPPTTQSNLPVRCVDTEGLSLWQRQRRPPLFLSCVLLLAVHWCPYLLVHLGCELLQLTVPSYASVNTLWVSCANSLLVGLTYWRHAGHQGGHQHSDFNARRLDGICDWRIAGYLSYHGNHDPPQQKLPLELQTPLDRKLNPLLLL